jgi:hypothetical protein
MGYKAPSIAAYITQKCQIIVVRREVAVRRELGGVGLGPAQVRRVPPVEQTMPHKRARYALRGILPAYGIQSAIHRSLTTDS